MKAVMEVESGGVRLAVQEDGPRDGIPVVLLHGLTATRRYVVMGSRRLERSGHRVIAYDARGHGESSPAPDREYGYEALGADLEAVMDALEVERAVLAGSSMGAHTLLAFALAHPDRVRALVPITPAYEPEELGDQARLDRWDALAAGLREGGVEGFLRAYDTSEIPAQWHDTLVTVMRQRLSQHRHPEALADALEVVPRSAPFARISDLEAIAAPTTVVASRDEADPGHPCAVGEAYAKAIPGARLLTEEPGRSPLAWQGGQLSAVIAEAAEAAR
jgi:pimeloyl-ACP methyl ester carboxylesterase